jgi:ariadne-1
MPLCCCAQVLSNSYAFAYFFFGGQLYAEEFSEDENRVNQNLFEDSQEMLAGEVGVSWDAASS